MPFTRKSVIITGAAGNLGSALARLLALRGARVIAVDASDDGLNHLSLSGSGHLMLPRQDLADPSACKRIVERALKEAGAKVTLISIKPGTIAGKKGAAVARLRPHPVSERRTVRALRPRARVGRSSLH